MHYTKMVTTGYVIFKKKLNIKLLRHDDERRPIEIGHPSDPGDLKGYRQSFDKKGVFLSLRTGGGE